MSQVRSNKAIIFVCRCRKMMHDFISDTLYNPQLQQNARKRKKYELMQGIYLRQLLHNALINISSNIFYLTIFFEFLALFFALL